MSIQTDVAISSESIRREYPQGPIPASHAITFREGKVLLARRAHQPSKGHWSVPGGMIELGETIHEAARRELREECGVEVETNEVVDVVDSIVLDESGHIRFHAIAQNQPRGIQDLKCQPKDAGYAPLALQNRRQNARSSPLEGQLAPSGNIFAPLTLST
jgi:ADP-ribose pyrophosphatase YjhB (NUDIX family)